MLILWVPVVIIILLGLWALQCACCGCKSKPSWQKVGCLPTVFMVSNRVFCGDGLRVRDGVSDVFKLGV